MPRVWRFANTCTTSSKQQQANTKFTMAPYPLPSDKLFKIVISGRPWYIETETLRRHSKLVDHKLEDDYTGEYKRELDLTDITNPKTLSRVLHWMHTGELLYTEAECMEYNELHDNKFDHGAILLLEVAKIHVLAKHLQIRSLKDKTSDTCKLFLQKSVNLDQRIWPALRYITLFTERTDTDLRPAFLTTCLFNDQMKLLREKEPKHKIFVFLRRLEPVLMQVVENMM